MTCDCFCRCVPCVSYIKLDAQVVHCDFNAPRHWIRLSNSIEHNVYSGLTKQRGM